MLGTVYLHVNKLSGRAYVGQTWNPARRKRAYLRDRTYFSRALRKHGWENFDHTYIPVETQAEMDNLERVWIALLGTTNRELGYNIQPGGRSYGKHSESTKQKIAAKARGRKVSPETCRKISESHRGVSSGMKGKKASPETRRKMSLAHHGFRHTPETRRKMTERQTGNTWGVGRVPWNKGIKYHNRRTLNKGVSNGCC